MAGYIPKEELKTFTRWQADDFARLDRHPVVAPALASTPRATPEQQRLLSSSDSEHPAAGEVMRAMSGSGIPLPTAEELERLHEDAHKEGYQSGFAEGREAGFAEGREAGLAEGHADGMADGRRAGFEAGATEAGRYVERCHALARGLQEALERFDQEVAEAVLACGLEVARQMMRGALRVKPEVVLPVIREALAMLPLQHGAVVLSVAPDALELVQEHLGGQFEAAGWRIQGDPQIEAGGCRVQAGGSEIDATYATRWKRTLEALGASLSGDDFILNNATEHEGERRSER
ncbi:MAG: flagellar assembly protein FliH [Zoogloeaceae bacterium]|jgi:flagellar assembly protein FliH|nr:flagellar assembly protein FliH [Zoogloeaceae bacterium]